MFAGSTTFLPGSDGYDPYRYYADEPVIAGWRELDEPISGRRYWNHAGMKLTTWSLVETIRFGALEDFLMSGIWGLFVAMPEDIALYEDLKWGVDLYETLPFRGEPVGRLQRGAVVVSIGIPVPGIMEVLVSSAENVVARRFCKCRFPAASGKRLLQRLPVREQEEPSTAVDIKGCEWVVVDAAAETEGAESIAELVVTENRDPRSPVMGRISAGTRLRLLYMVGTRARIADVDGGSLSLRGGWVSVLYLDTAATIARLMPVTRDDSQDDKRQQPMLGGDATSELPDHAAGPRVVNSRHEGSNLVRGQLALEIDRVSLGPPVKAKHLPEPAGQRTTVIGGWRQVMDPIWQRPMYIHPTSGVATFNLGEVLRTGGLDDFLLGQMWQLCIVDPLAVEAQRDLTWSYGVFADLGMTGQPMVNLPKGHLVIVQHFDEDTRTATIVLPSIAPDCPISVGYARARLMDGRPILRALLQVVNEEGLVAEVSTSDQGPVQPDDAILEGPYYVTPPDGIDEIEVQIGQDLESDAWARLPRGAQVQGFEEVAGFRALLMDIDGGGWVSLIGAGLQPFFRKEPTVAFVQATAADLHGTKQLTEEEVDIPVVWPYFGIVRPAKPLPPVEEPPERTLPDLLARVGGGRAMCDWHRDVSVLSPDHSVYRSKLTGARTSLNELLTKNIWKACIVEIDQLPIREAENSMSSQVFVYPRGSLIVAEWVAPSNAVRVLWPPQANAHSPHHAWADLYSFEGTALVPLQGVLDFWVEPRGGHLPLELQRDEDTSNRMFVPLMDSINPGKGKQVGKVERGDGVQVAEMIGRHARVIVTSRVFLLDYPTGWMNIFDEAGWSQLRRRTLGERHAIFEEMEKPEIFEVQKHQPRPPPPIKEHVYELPALLAQLGELEQGSMNVRDWREARDPIWGRRVFVNKWSGQVIHRLASMNVAYATVRLRLWFINLSIEAVRTLGGSRAEVIIDEIRAAVHEKLAAIAEVPEKAAELQFLDGIEAVESPARLNTANSADSIADGADIAMKKGATFCMLFIIKAPGAIIAWANTGLKKAMAKGERFIDLIVMMLTGVPNFNMLRTDPNKTYDVVKAELEEVDLPREKPAPKAEQVMLAVDDDIAKLRKNLRYAKPKVMQFPGRELGEGNMRALADGLQLADAPFVEELGLWNCQIGDCGAYALAAALDRGCGKLLQTLLLDDNRISAEGAQALGITLPQCPQLRELSIARNPLGKGFIAIAAGLREEIVTLDASATLLPDLAVRAAAELISRWPQLRTLKLGGNPAVQASGLEAMARALPRVPELKWVDLQGCTVRAADGEQWQQLLVDAGLDPQRLRF